MFRLSLIFFLLAFSWNSRGYLGRKSCQNNLIALNESSINKILNSDTISLNYTDSIQGVWPEFIGKFKKGESVRLVDLDSIKNAVDIDQGLAPLDKIPNATKGFKLYTYYSKNIPTRIHEAIPKWYYPVYVVNESKHIRYFTLKDDYVFALQEAMYTDGNWYPIEKRGPEECLNGEWSIKVKPTEFLVFTMNKYSGTFKTKIRVRLKIGRLVYYSDPFEGYININQFFIKNSSLINAFFSDRGFVLWRWFYDAVPLQAKLKQ